ncbi:acetyl-CoA/propionyl-CoA carboxylase biotin carboxyl carrier protein [Arthrobacter sp. V4I6]|uniref:acetyl/propionyl/methylcrotonyl-CoA carboxylase subunit alpha n=1 Tax=unclassified Arthrobacter TaxID=235627 RepID=UPI002789495C|nr:MULTISPECIES: biotin carboxylase N-terminal domain-containing protein [unclassified Arthrobacter]MDQ0821974.1 acetyl-CoA/propionyl-CoA carboxylase biotin carboxyl carrier protein [Arthrobacter sp. V1I7]MDQ0856243.1 acetyl-CoA/propionyl-CoA carboxylase biotin carboxyl carrier protein [Arthrobacter sp. V4I6]
MTSPAPSRTPTPPKPLFGTVLVANRGEIACRVIRTLRALGIRSVAVYSDADAGARHVHEADVAVRIGPAAAAESYLKIEAIIQACRGTGAEAVHPGYGFLSENVDFARALADAGITFIGPGVESLNVMGDKIRAKNHVAGYGVPVVPGAAEPGMTDAQLIGAAAGVGFPLLIKPSAGGGGKGMHIVERPDELEATLATARRVAASAFGDDTLFLERLVLTPRHIEVQVLADNHGNVIHLGERECSLQRRHQKVIEEAPSPLLEALDDGGATRARIGEAACNAARSVHYSGAGTVEFLVSDNAPDEFFFMEMNTRLQVEHPVTEMVTGVDLVEWQVRIAAGEALTVTQDDVVLNGHSVEARVYAEIPERNFLPSGGEVALLDERGTVFTAKEDRAALSPASADPALRIDSSLREGLVISSDYDPMLSKVIAWGADRAAALDKLDAALARYTVLGVETNVEYLRLLINDADVRAGRLDTGLIERRMPDFSFRRVGDAELIAAAMPFWVQAQARGHTLGLATAGSPWASTTGWRLGAPAPWTISFGVPGGGLATVAVTWQSNLDLGHARVRVDGGPEHPVKVLGLSGSDVLLEVDGGERRFARASAWADHPPAGRPQAVYVGNEGWSCRLEVLSREAKLARVLAAIERVEGAADPAVRSPMPGTVVSVSVRNGDAVEAGQVLVSVEAMKMEHQLVAPLDGTVHISVASGDLVKADQVLATIHAGDHPRVPSTAEDAIEEAAVALGAAE